MTTLMAHGARAVGNGRRFARTGLAALAALLVATTALATSPADAQTAPATSTTTPSAAPTVVRLGGDDPATTASAVSATTFATGVGIAYVATSAAYPDALAGGAAAGGKGPILFVDQDQVPASTAGELRRLAPKRIAVLGGPAAVSDATLHALGQYTAGSVSRLAGDDRYATAAAISAATFTTGVAVAYVATGATFPDALAGASAAAGGAPILLTAPDQLPDATATELQRLAPKRIAVFGGPAAVSDAVVTALGQYTTGDVSRLAGADRYATAAAIARTVPVTKAATVFLATGDDFHDALAASPAAVKAGAPLVLVATAALPDPAAAELGRRGATKLVVVGGQAELPDATVDQAATAAAPAVPDAASGAPTAVSTAQAQVGKPYQWAGAGPDSFDCSGLTAYAWNAAGTSLPHNTVSQRSVVAAVPITLLQPGDLVFFGSDIHHVGIYVGDGQMVEAPRTGVPVRQSPIWRSDLFAAGRPGVAQTSGTSATPATPGTQP